MGYPPAVAQAALRITQHGRLSAMLKRAIKEKALQSGGPFCFHFHLSLLK